ncbi:MAG: glycosyltransferase [Candidatus Eisenbacteria bacterium]|nr:glycosyltransferase [Candidatus Eisenbacteria bacterium]
MKVTLVGHYPPPYGGVASLMRQMESALTLRGAKVTVFNLGAGRPRAANVLNFDTRNRARQFLQLARAFAVSDSDLVHYLSASYRSFWLGAVCVVLARLTGRKVVLSVVGGAFKDFVGSLGPLKRRVASACLGLCHAVVACNSEIEEALEALIPSKEVHRMENYFPVLAQEKADVPEAVRDFLNAHSPAVCTTGAASAEYGLTDAVEALGLLRREHTRAGMLVALTRYGGAAYEADLADKIRSLGLGEHVLIQKDLPDFVSVMKGSDAFLRSTLVDGDSISVREALFLGVPAVVSDTPFRPEGVIQFRKGDPRDMAEKLGLALSAGRGDRVAKAAEEGEQNLDKLLRIYDSVVESRRSPELAGRGPWVGPRSGYEA